MFLYFITILTKEIVDLRKYYGTSDSYDHLKFAGAIDAGSTGSRLNIYGFNNNKLIEFYYVDSVEPGVSALLKYEIAQQLNYLTSNAQKELKDIIRNIKEMPLAFLATAGLRLLSDKESNMILEEAREYFKKYNLKNENIKIITGAEEGILGLRSLLLQKRMESFIIKHFGCQNLKNKINSDYCKEMVKHSKHNHTYGMIDMGGGSVEVSFMDTEKHQLVSQSFLGYGINESLEMIKSHPNYDLCKYTDTSSKECKEIFDEIFRHGPTKKLTKDITKMDEIFFVSFYFDKILKNSSSVKRTLSELESVFKNKCDNLGTDECIRLNFLILLLKYFEFKKDTQFFLISNIMGININWTIAKAFDLIYKK